MGRLNSQEKIAYLVNGMEGSGKHFVMNGEEAEKTLHREKQEKFNTTVEEYTDKFNQHYDKLNEMSKDMNGLEILPMGTYVLIKPYDNNPFQKITKTDSGIITDLGGFQLQHKNQETGDIEDDQMVFKVGEVVETGFKCEFIKPGDVVFYTIYNETMVPFFKLGLTVVNENRILAVVNTGLTERKKNL
jgi:co-chaperonin GroES (HSP10)